VSDVRPYLWGAAVAAAPLFTARGIQNKVLEAVASGLPTVVTPNMVDSLPKGVADACVVGASATELAAQIGGLLSMSPTERRAFANRADMRSLTWDRQLAPFQRLVDEAAQTRRLRG
jgi:hypothetical protein